MKYAKYIIPSIGLVVSFCINLVILRVWQGASGLDIYYYALQTKALTITGAQLFSDHSPVYRFLWAVNCLLHNPVLSVQVVSSFNIALTFLCLLMISLRGGFSLYKTATATIAIFNPATFYLMLEFTKNSFAFAFFFLAWVLLTDEENKIIVLPQTKTAIIRLILWLLVLLLSAFSHRMMLLLFLCFLVHAGFISFWQSGGRPSRKTIQFSIIMFGITFLGFGAVAFSHRSLLAERLSILSLDAPLQRMSQFVRSDLFLGEHVFYIFIQVAVFFLVPLVVIIRKQYLKPEVVFAAIAWLFLFPFLQFGWDEIGFRLLILAPILLAPWLISLDVKFPKVTACILFAVSILFTVESALNLTVAKGPNYRAFNESFASIQELAKGKRLIVHRGLAGWLWFEKGIRSENFLPVSEPEKYLRVVYAFSPDILEYYLGPDDPLPVQLNRDYSLTEEYIWQRFYQDRKELRLLKSEMNPFLPRPVSAFVINEEVSAKLSPVSDWL